MSTAAPQKYEFQAEIKQLLDIVIHSLYTEKEIFVRELVSNASDALEKLRHTQLTEKEIADDQLTLEINLTTDDKAKTLTIQDTGIGIPKASQDKIFAKFFRAQNVMRQETTGTGLGLYVVKGLVTTLHGRVWFKSEEHEGTTFYVSLPKVYENRRP